MLDIHNNLCPNAANPRIQLSLDGVSESKSTNISLDVYSCRFLSCKNIYPLKIVRPLLKDVINNRKELDEVVDDVNQNQCEVCHVIGDNPKRAILREAMNHASYYACEYCHSKASQMTQPSRNLTQSELKNVKLQTLAIDNQIQLLKTSPGTSGQKQKDDATILQLENLKKDLTEKKRKFSHVLWPASTRDSKNDRNMEEITDIMNLIKQKEDGEIATLSPDQLKGFKSRSKFLDLTDFDFINSIPTEYMHALCSGVMKRLTELTFNVGKNRIRVTKRRLSSPTLYNNLMRDVKVPREFSRRARQLDLSVLKAQEFRNILLFFFPIVLQCIETDALERNLWLFLVFMIRSCILPDDEYSLVDQNDILECSKSFYELFQQLFGVRNCSYSVHIIASHLLNMRFSGPLTETSAFIFENFYGELRHSFVPGTKSPLKQMMQQILLKRSLTFHCCQNSIYLSAKDTALESNSIVYIFHNGRHKMYKIISIDKDDKNHLNCVTFGCHPMYFTEITGVSWSSIGIYKQGEIGIDPIDIRRKNVSGKVIQISDLLITCPINILREK